MPQNPYGPRFWLTYVANTALMTTVSLLFRYADFVASMGGTEAQIGLITGLGMVGAISARCVQGVAIDRWGAARIWVGSLVLLVVCLLCHLLLSTLTPPLIHLLRIAYTVSLAGAFGASITYVSLRAPPSRMGEMIGMLGSSGFVGLALGPPLGDWIFAQYAPGEVYGVLFRCAAGAAGISLISARLATWAQAPARDSAPTASSSSGTRPDVDTGRGDRARQVGAPQFLSTVAATVREMWATVRRHASGWILLVGFAMGVGIGMPGTFLSPFAAERGIAELRWFFLPYAIVAFIVRICTRTLPDRWGTRPTILLGLACLGGSMLLFFVVQSPPTLIIPAVPFGLAHAFLFPATVSAGSQTFPAAARGLATNLTLMMFDLGLLIGQPVFGWTVEFSGGEHWDGYSVAFTVLSAFLLAVAFCFSRVASQPRETIQAKAT